jgi:hypothetical protein
MRCSAAKPEGNESTNGRRVIHNQVLGCGFKFKLDFGGELDLNASLLGVPLLVRIL